MSGKWVEWLGRLRFGLHVQEDMLHNPARGGAQLAYKIRQEALNGLAQKIDQKITEEIDQETKKMAMSGILTTGNAVCEGFPMSWGDTYFPMGYGDRRFAIKAMEDLKGAYTSKQIRTNGGLTTTPHLSPMDQLRADVDQWLKGVLE